MNVQELISEIEIKSKRVSELERKIKMIGDQKTLQISELKNNIEKLEVQLEMKNQKMKELVMYKKHHDQYQNDLS